MNKKHNTKSDKVFLVLDEHGVTYVVTVPKETTESESRHIADTILMAVKQWYKTPIKDRDKMHHDSLKFVRIYVKISGIKNITIEEAG